MSVTYCLLRCPTSLTPRDLAFLINAGLGVDARSQNWRLCADPVDYNARLLVPWKLTLQPSASFSPLAVQPGEYLRYYLVFWPSAQEAQLNVWTLLTKVEGLAALSNSQEAAIGVAEPAFKLENWPAVELSKV